MAKQAQSTQERILDAAIHLFASHGYAATNMRSLAQRAKVDVTTIYYQFQSKRGLHSAAFDAAYGLIPGEQLPPIPLLAVLPTLIGTMRQHENAIKMFYFATLEGSLPASRLATSRKRWLAQLVPYLRECKVRGVVRADVDEGVAATSILAVALHMHRAYHLRAIHTKAEYQHLIDGMAELWARGIQAT